MILADGDRIELPPGVRLDGSRLADAVRGDSWPVNESGRLILASSDRPLGAIAGELAARYGIEPERAREDVMSFAGRLNALCLLNVRASGFRHGFAVRWAVTAFRLGTLRRLPHWPLRRHDLPDTRRAVAAARALAPRSTALAVGVAATLLLVGAVPPPSSVAAGLGVGAGLALHELGHVVALRGAPAAIVTVAAETFVLHAPLSGRRRRLVALAGPFVASGAGVAVLAGALATGSQAAALAGAALCAHAASVTVLASDGRAACAP